MKFSNDSSLSKSCEPIKQNQRAFNSGKNCHDNESRDNFSPNVKLIPSATSRIIRNQYSQSKTHPSYKSTFNSTIPKNSSPEQTKEPRKIRQSNLPAGHRIQRRSPLAAATSQKALADHHHRYDSALPIPSSTESASARRRDGQQGAREPAPPPAGRMRRPMGRSAPAMEPAPCMRASPREAKGVLINRGQSLMGRTAGS